MKQALFIVLAVTFGALAMPAMGFHNATACERRADKMFRSCRFEINEEYYATTAMCINQTGAGDPSKPACFDTAVETYWEDRGGCGDQREARKDVCELLDEDIYRLPLGS